MNFFSLFFTSILFQCLFYFNVFFYLKIYSKSVLCSPRASRAIIMPQTHGVSNGYACKPRLHFVRTFFAARKNFALDFLRQNRGVMKQVIALSDANKAKEYIAEMSKKEPGVYWFIMEKKK